MIIGLGIDFVNVNRMRHWTKTDGIIQRYFHPNEIEASFSRGSSAILSFAARFAAKEAFGKALGTGLKGLRLTDIEVKNNHNGKPEIILYETALEAFMDLGGSTMHISLSHEHDAAVAVVVIEG